MKILFDIGGTKTRISQSLGEKLGDVLFFDTPQDYHQGISLFVENCKGLYTGEIEALLGGVAGVLNKDKRSLFCAPNLPQWVGQDIVSDIEKMLNTKVVLENDAALAGLGEAVYGAGRDFKIVAFITISTGIGGVRIVNGKIDDHLFGFEPGHHFMDIEKNIDFEGLVSGHVLAEKYGKTTEDLMDAQVWDDIEKICAKGLLNVMTFWSPEVIVLGGGVTHTDMFNIEKVNQYLKEFNKIYPEIPQIKLSELNDLSGIYGALVYSKAP